jgi:A118 family predicted phage portal protein
VGTGALALWFDAKEDGTTDIRARRYDARMVLPLSWDDDGVTACAFVTDAYLDGRKVHQLQVHESSDETGTYHVATRVFDAESGDELAPDGIIPDFDTLSESPTFAIVRPALDNVYAEGTYMGQSVFADAIDAIKGVDNAFDSMQREINATKVKVFASADMFDVETGEDGIARAVPMDPDDLWVVKLDTATADEMYEVFSPTIRTAQLAEALNVGLAELGDLTGFGQDYFRYDKRGGLRTATEVSADNSAFMRNIRKHENELRPQLEALLACLLACQRALNGWTVPEGCGVRVDFDDSIIQDTSAEKAQMLAEVSANVVPRWMYLERFYGMDEEEARRVAGDPEVLDMGA